MKKFKNDICVRGSSALCKAFASELKTIGYTFNAEQDNPICIVTYGGKSTNLLAHWNTSLGVNPIQLVLPQDWDKALALASEVVEPEVIKPVITKPKSEFNIGNWVINKKTSAVYKIEEIDKDGWCNSKQTPGGGWSPTQLRLATNEEIKQQLIKLARDRGFVDGVTFKGCNGGDKNVPIKIGVDYQINAMLGNNEGVFCGNSWILHKSKWGTIVEEVKTITYTTGQRFEDMSDSSEYILAHCGDLQVALINLKNGNLYSDKIKVKSLSKITEKEFEEICGGDDFKLIK